MAPMKNELAQRWRKSRGWPIVLLLLVGCEAEGVEEAQQTAAPTFEGGEKTLSKETEANASEELATVPIGEEAVLTTAGVDFGIKVKEASCQEGPVTFEDPEGLFVTETYTPVQGQFCTVIINVHNVGTEPGFFYRDAVLATAEGISYGADSEASSTATNYLEGGFLGIEINPGITMTERFLFDVPLDAEPAELVVSSLDSGSVVLDLP